MRSIRDVRRLAACDAASGEQGRKLGARRHDRPGAAATGIQLADETLGARPARFMAEANLARLDQLKARLDPAGRFHAYMGQARRAGLLYR